MNKKFTFALILLTLMVLASSCENNTTDPDTFVENPCDVHVDLNNDKICDNCQQIIENTESIYYCSLCDFVICNECFSKKATMLGNKKLWLIIYIYIKDIFMMSKPTYF